MGTKNQKHHHHIMPTGTALLIGGTLLFLTVVTVWIAHVDLGPLNFVIAMAVATVKALLVALFFMNLYYDHKENGMIFATSLLFLAIFMILTGTDLFFRGDVYVKGPLMAAPSGGSKIKNAWISTPELVAQGKELYAQQCVACHGAAGDGKGAAAAALNPPPRNFMQTTGWKNGRKPTMVFKTLKEGLPPSAMASYSTLPVDDRWKLVHYVLSLAPNPEKDTPADFAKIGIDPTKADGGGATAEAPTIPVEMASAQMESKTPLTGRLYQPGKDSLSAAMIASHPGAALYQASCVQCHGARGEGQIRVKNLGVNPVAYVTTRPFKASSVMKSQGAFNDFVIRGLPGELMPGMGHLSGAELRDLYQFIQKLN